MLEKWIVLSNKFQCYLCSLFPVIQYEKRCLTFQKYTNLITFIPVTASVHYIFNNAVVVLRWKSSDFTYLSNEESTHSFLRKHYLVHLMEVFQEI